jgi:hypothetical protein
VGTLRRLGLVCLNSVVCRSCALLAVLSSESLVLLPCIEIHKVCLWPPLLLRSQGAMFGARTPASDVLCALLTALWLRVLSVAGDTRSVDAALFRTVACH